MTPSTGFLLARRAILAACIFMQCIASGAAASLVLQTPPNEAGPDSVDLEIPSQNLLLTTGGGQIEFTVDPDAVATDAILVARWSPQGAEEYFYLLIPSAAESISIPVIRAAVPAHVSEIPKLRERIATATLSNLLYAYVNARSIVRTIRAQGEYGSAALLSRAHAVALEAYAQIQQRNPVFAEDRILSYSSQVMLQTGSGDAEADAELSGADASYRVSSMVSALNLYAPEAILLADDPDLATWVAVPAAGATMSGPAVRLDQDLLADWALPRGSAQSEETLPSSASRLTQFYRLEPALREEIYGQVGNAPFEILASDVSENPFGILLQGGR